MTEKRLTPPRLTLDGRVTYQPGPTARRPLWDGWVITGLAAATVMGVMGRACGAW